MTDQSPPDFTNPGDTLRVVSILAPDQLQQAHGMPKEAIAGALKINPAAPSKIDIGTFIPNPAFQGFLHYIIQTYGPEDPSLQSAAARQGQGYVYIIDMRTPKGPQGNVPPEDIVGVFEVQEGQLVKESYKANGGHKVLTVHGLVRLPPFLHRALIQELKQLDTRK